MSPTMAAHENTLLVRKIPIANPRYMFEHKTVTNLFFVIVFNSLVFPLLVFCSTIVVIVHLIPIGTVFTCTKVSSFTQFYIEL